MKPILVMRNPGAGLAAALTVLTITGAGDSLDAIQGMAKFELNPDGFAYKTESVGDGTNIRTQMFQWKTGGGAASAYEVLATTVSGTAGTGTIGSAVNLASAVTWTRTRTLAGSVSWVINPLIRIAGGGSTLAAATNMTLTATA